MRLDRVDALALSYALRSNYADLRKAARDIIVRALDDHEGRPEDAARDLGVSRSYLYHICNELLEPQELRDMPELSELLAAPPATRRGPLSLRRGSLTLTCSEAP